METSSPYFGKRRRLSEAAWKKSRHFALCRPSLASALGCVQSLGSTVDCLDPSFKDVTDEEGPDGQSPCETCLNAQDERLILQHFGDCEVFLEHWKASANDTTRIGLVAQGSDFEVLQEQRLQASVRHLCLHHCYLRAFAPYRNWYALCQAVGQRYAEDSLHVLLQGWKCWFQLDPSYLPRTVFVSPDGRRFRSTRLVLDHLRSNETSTAANSDESTFNLPDYTFQHALYTKSVDSPFGLLEELFANDPWRLLLSTIFLNRTSRVQVDHVLYRFLQIWPDYNSVICADVDDVRKLIRPLGIGSRRAAGLIRFSTEYKDLLARKARQGETCSDAHALHSVSFSLERKDIVALYNCGDYAWSAYRLFILRQLDFEPVDHALHMYADCKRGLSQLEENRM